MDKGENEDFCYIESINATTNNCVDEHPPKIMKTLMINIGGKQYDFLVYPPRNVLLYSPIRSIIFILHTFEIFPLYGGLKMLKIFKKHEFSK